MSLALIEYSISVPTSFTLESFFFFFPSLPPFVWNYCQNLLHLTGYTTQKTRLVAHGDKNSISLPCINQWLFPSLICGTCWWDGDCEKFGTYVILCSFCSLLRPKGKAISKATWQIPTGTFSYASRFMSGKGNIYRRQVRMALRQIWKLEYN